MIYVKYTVLDHYIEYTVFYMYIQKFIFSGVASGLILEPVWDSAGNRLETVIVSGVEEGGVADRCGVWEGDEVTRVNGRSVREAGWVGTRSSLDGTYINTHIIYNT